MRLDEIWKASSSRLETVRVIRTALNPLLWLVGLTFPSAIGAAVVVGDPSSRIVLLSFAAAPVLVAIVAYFIFMFRDPDRLQSEEYQIRQRALRILYKWGATAEIVDIAKQIPRSEKLAGGFEKGDGD